MDEEELDIPGVLEGLSHLFEFDEELRFFFRCQTPLGFHAKQRFL